ncbi:AmmeMemoRadiSam system protein A [Dechloromonas sp. XY25]|uniref:AmmeMemoRadiSam system protein A n=1 Tax=Dechloromonas hankyongensis TaxID=2908002 RepID=A0ABS9K3E3_9RHOO|nr:AmmeMemoRadiSam system protein A [Dechloromonas hankyongensis]MCG2577656.1 AmmeMemoRadiSam system protein A [Dechloromonas hankyongensis]
MPDPGPSLLTLARNAIAGHFGLPPRPLDDTPELHENGASFVTLTQHGRLRGCIGSLEAWRPLAQDVRENALAAAFHDPRFEPLSADEWPATRVEVSLLTPAVALSFSDEADALAQLRPGVDGVIFSVGNRRSTFLPQVWEQLPDPALFMARLKQKAGLPVEYWSPSVRLERYAVRKWKEKQP